MHKFTYEFIKKNTINADLFSLSNIIIDLKNKTDAKKNVNKSLFTSLETIAIKESVAGSNAIEGIFTTKNRITEIIENDSVPLTHDEEEIAGYHDAIKFITKNYENLSFNEETIKHIHLLLVARHKGYKEAGTYKKEDNLITEKYPDGSVKRVIFTPVPAKQTSQAMKELCLAYQIARDDYMIPSLLLIPCLIVDFLAIHPFSDGNGRVSRLLTLLLLYKEGFDIGKFISFENQINEYKSSYYQALELSQQNWHDNKGNYVPFINFTFQILYECYKEINRRFIFTKNGKNKKCDRIEAIILDSIVPISKVEINELCPDISITTIEATLAKLIKENKIIKIGSYKDAKYLRKK